MITVVAIASPVSITTRNSQTKYGTLTYVYYETSSGPASSTPSTNTAFTPLSSNGSYSLARASTAYLWSPQFGSAATINAGSWVVGLWAASTSYISSYIPITIINNQTSATPSSFQEKITWNPSSYTSYEASDLGNIRFYSDSAFTTPLYAWLESCTPSLSNTATNATAWINLTSSIAQNGGTLTIYMAFLSTGTSFDGNYWGDAPNLSGTYGAYDNGANVFKAYFNGNTPTSNFSAYTGDTIAKATGISGPGGTTINAIKVTGSSGGHFPAFAFNKALSNTDLIAESSFSLAAGFTGAETGAVGLVDKATATSIQNGISADMGFNSVYFNQAYEIAGVVTMPVNQAGTSTTSWVYASVTYPGSAAPSWSAYIAPQLYSSTGGYSGSISNNPLSSATNLYLGQISGTSAINVLYNFVRARAYPPNNVMPSASFGTLSFPTNVVKISVYITNSSGSIQSTVASNIQSPAVTSSAAQYTLSFAGNQVNIPVNGYIMISFSATQVASYVIYWGNGRPTNFQVPYRVLS